MEAGEVLALSRVRGMLVGLAVGEAVGAAGGVPSSGPLRSGTVARLGACTVEGMLRAIQRQSHKGICHEPTVVLRAYQRWAVLQGIELPDPPRLDGWLVGVPQMAVRCGDAPATVGALMSGRPTGSHGWHAMARTLPLAAFSRAASPEVLTRLAGELAALTHGHPDAADAARAGVLVLDGVMRDAAPGDPPRPVVQPQGADGRGALAVAHALELARTRPRDLGVLRGLCTDASGLSALAAGCYVAQSFPEPGEVVESLALASRAPRADAVATVVGAIQGTRCGIEAWPVPLVARLDLVWPLDVLARDAVTGPAHGLGGSEWTAPPDPAWWDRYPGS